MRILQKYQVSTLQWRHMGVMASSITSLTSVYSTVYSGADQRKYQRSTSLALVREIHRWPANSPHKGPVTRKMFPFDDVIMSPHWPSQCAVIRLYPCIVLNVNQFWAQNWNPVCQITCLHMSRQFRCRATWQKRPNLIICIYEQHIFFDI